jgi:LacI family transcriptional regulator
MPTIKQIAEKAGVSPTTVANVIHGRTDQMSSKNAEKVRRILDELHYTPNLAASMLAHKTEHIIGVVTIYTGRDNISVLQDIFFGSLIGTLETEIDRAGYYTMIYSCRTLEAVMKLALTWNLAGLIVLGLPPGASTRFIATVKKPVVFIDSYYRNDSEDLSVPAEFAYYNVGLDDWQGGYIMTKYLLSQGHRKILFCADQDDLQGVDKQRYLGYAEALSEMKVTPVPRNIDLTLSRSSREAVLDDLLDRRDEFSALFFASDYYASEAVHYFTTHGIRIPRDFSVAGFDDNDFSRLTTPSLTTIRQNVRQKAVESIKLLLSVINRDPVPQKNIRLPVELIIRDSVSVCNT